MPNMMHHDPAPPTPPDHADQAADHVLALVAATDPAYQPTPEKHASMVALIRALVRLVSGGAR